MTRRTKCLLFGLLAVAGLGGGLVAWHYVTTPQPGVTVENFHRLRLDMGFDQVVAILGPPEERLDKTPPDAGCTVQEKLWYAGGLAVEVVVEDGMVTRGSLLDEQSGTELEPIRPAEPVLATVRRLLHL